MNVKQIAIIMLSAIVCAVVVVVVLNLLGMSNPVPIAGGVAGGVAGAFAASRIGKDKK